VHEAHDAQDDVHDAAVDAGAAEDVAPDVSDVPTPCTPLRARALGTGWNHALAIDPGGVLAAWGANGSGQLGLGEHGDRSRAQRALEGGVWRTVVGGSRHSCGIREDGSLWCWGTNVHGQLGVGDTADRMQPTRVGDAADWVEVACGGLHSCGVRQGRHPLVLGAPTLRASWASGCARATSFGPNA
jgi:alpha-tubulin suppressor-like RCC1 family protein